MGEDRSAFADEPTWPRAQGRSTHLERDHACSEDRLPWQDCPKEYVPHKTVYNRFARWSARGVWQKIFECVATPSDPPEQVALDSSYVKAHRCAHGGKGGPIF